MKNDNKIDVIKTIYGEVNSHLKEQESKKQHTITLMTAIFSFAMAIKIGTEDVEETLLSSVFSNTTSSIIFAIGIIVIMFSLLFNLYSIRSWHIQYQVAAEMLGKLLMHDEIISAGNAAIEAFTLIELEKREVKGLNIDNKQQCSKSNKKKKDFIKELIEKGQEIAKVINERKSQAHSFEYKARKELTIIKKIFSLDSLKRVIKSVEDKTMIAMSLLPFGLIISYYDLVFKKWFINKEYIFWVLLIIFFVLVIYFYLRKRLLSRSYRSWIIQFGLNKELEKEN